ncbi:unnamed protein product [Candidula unifasciata]|uniref:Dynein regulatory complex subunit 4 n=1 Tax=Candidula unifasciata TaxID=100452 RepID=A0A8S3ZIC7_9EUPU|nr:unnamed protein product [Candidula unifasciata]
MKIQQARLTSLTSELQDVKWERELLEQSHKKAQLERDELYHKFLEAIQEVQQKCSFKNLLLEKKLASLADILEKRESQLNEVLSLTKVDPTSICMVTRKLEDVLDSKNSAIRDLQYELARTCKAHNDLLRTCEKKLSQFGIPKDSLEFKPLENTARGQSLGAGPAGLVSNPT